MNKTSEIMAAMKYDGPLETIDRLQAHGERLEAQTSGAGGESMAGLVLIGVLVGLAWFIAGLGVGFLIWGLK